MRVKPFRALRPRPELAATVAAVPYDVVSAEEARSLGADNPLSFLHVSRSEIDLPPGTDPYSDAVYARAAANLRGLRTNGTMGREEEPAFYVYAQGVGGYTQRGIAACCHIGDYENNVIRKHENTRKEKEADRVRHIGALQAHTEPVFLMYRDSADADRIVTAVERTRPLFDFTASDGVRHTVWRASDNAAITGAFASVQQAYIADGHHRAAAAWRFGSSQRTDEPPAPHAGGGEREWFLALLYPAGKLRIMAYNRIVRDLNGMSAAQFVKTIKTRFRAVETRSAVPSRRGRAHMYVAGAWYELALESARGEGGPAPAAAQGAAGGPAKLDCAALQDDLLEPILGVADPRTSDRIDFAGGNTSPEELARKVDAGEWAVAFSLYPVSTDDVMACSDAGGIMPPKSTWFAPKPRSGLLIHTFGHNKEDE